LVFPDNYKKAGEYAQMAASVGHDGNGIYGAVFIASLYCNGFPSSVFNDATFANACETKNIPNLNEALEVFEFPRSATKPYRSIADYFAKR